MPARCGAFRPEPLKIAGSGRGFSWARTSGCLGDGETRDRPGRTVREFVTCECLRAAILWTARGSANSLSTVEMHVNLIRFESFRHQRVAA